MALDPLPEILFSSRTIQEARPSDPFGGVDWSVEYHNSLASTQTRAKELGMNGTERAVVVAGRQTEGRGRRDRRWESPGDGLYFSLLYRPRLAGPDLPFLGLAAVLAVESAVREKTGISPDVKWPNDLLL